MSRAMEFRSPVIIFTAAVMSMSLGVGWPRDASADVTDSLAPSAELGEDEVTLKQGGMLRGTIREELAGKHVVIKVHGIDQARTIPWSRVERVERGKHTPRPSPEHVKPPPAMPCPPADSAPLGPPRPGLVRIHIEQDHGPRMQLYRWTGAGSWTISEWGSSIGSQEFGPPLGEFICRTPCDAMVDGSKGHEFVLSGLDVPDSKPFQLLDRSGNVTMHVSPGSFFLARLPIVLKYVFTPMLTLWSIGLTIEASRADRDRKLDAMTRAGVFWGAAGFTNILGFVLDGIDFGGTTYEIVGAGPSTASSSSRFRPAWSRVPF